MPATSLSRLFTRQRGLWCVLIAITLVLPSFIAPTGAILVSIMAALAAIVALWQWPTGPISLVTAVSAVSIASLIVDLAYYGVPGMILAWLPIEFLALLVLVIRAIRMLSARQVATVGVLAAVSVLALPLRISLRTPADPLGTSIAGVALAVFPLAIAVGIGFWLRSLDNRRLQAIATARREQRLAVAKDLHDFVAHEVTGIVVEMQAAQVVPYNPAEAQALFSRVEQAGLRALASMDRTVAALRNTSDVPYREPSPQLYGLADVPELVARFSASSSGQVQFTMDDAVIGKLERETDATAYTIVLEALTNIRRHAPNANQVTVEIALSPDSSIHISVSNELLPDHADVVREGGGTGLVGLTERVETLGGTLRAGPADATWQVHVVLPVPTMSRRRIRRLLS